ncbi:DNA topology modulation protein [Peribacillus psychrosaccharolyticus]|uniref:DNA topology modulation protein n=1 Tax=Peribacillus psychrosaccharolyticus TaxID=1407 RepID=A0A974S206_PERPY|nr:DNA topology modulation protein [Peribacillus psychrosaccharolyticus]MEC2054989.1 DNA topology modulation protein [Peribacillus psychrosaccharolyticus]MED3746510.1 DNA topology modulation protein [Peribacillus psychrosaccharolyticus]QQT02094.1 DNA topology modulation protein [Peribacillus psychrosaccharolyticus]
MKRVIILGCCGSGKSTLALKLAEKINSEVIHLDTLFWKPGWVQSSSEEFIMRQESLLTGDKWIVDGNYHGTLDLRLEPADTVIYLDFPTSLCLYRIVKRRVMYQGKTRPDMARDCPEKIDLEFFNYVRTFNRKKAPAIKKRLNNLEGKKVYLFKNSRQVEQFLHQI